MTAHVTPLMEVLASAGSGCSRTAASCCGAHVGPLHGGSDSRIAATQAPHQGTLKNNRADVSWDSSKCSSCLSALNVYVYM